MKSIVISVAEALVQRRLGDCVVNHLNTATTSKNICALLGFFVFLTLIDSRYVSIIHSCSVQCSPVGGSIC